MQDTIQISLDKIIKTKLEKIILSEKDIYLYHSNIYRYMYKLCLSMQLLLIFYVIFSYTKLIIISHDSHNYHEGKRDY